MGYSKLLIAIFGFLTFPFVPATFAQVKIGQKVPDFATTTLGGEKFVLKDYLKQPGNKVLILTFFATWCEPCGDDLQYLQKIHDQYKDQGLRVLLRFHRAYIQGKGCKKIPRKARREFARSFG